MLRQCSPPYFSQLLWPDAVSGCSRISFAAAWIRDIGTVSSTTATKSHCLPSKLSCESVISSNCSSIVRWRDEDFHTYMQGLEGRRAHDNAFWPALTPLTRGSHGAQKFFRFYYYRKNFWLWVGRLGVRDVAFGMDVGQAISRPLRKMIIVQAYKSTDNQLHIFKFYTLSLLYSIIWRGGGVTGLVTFNIWYGDSKNWGNSLATGTRPRLAIYGIIILVLAIAPDVFKPSRRPVC